MTVSQRFPTEKTYYQLSEGETSWSVALVGDFDGDNKSDTLWRDTPAISWCGS
jgi:hypothetical protein